MVWPGACSRGIHRFEFSGPELSIVALHLPGVTFPRFVAARDQGDAHESALSDAPAVLSGLKQRGILGASAALGAADWSHLLDPILLLALGLQRDTATHIELRTATSTHTTTHETFVVEAVAVGVTLTAPREASGLVEAWRSARAEITLSTVVDVWPLLCALVPPDHENDGAGETVFTVRAFAQGRGCFFERGAEDLGATAFDRGALRDDLLDLVAAIVDDTVERPG